MIDPLQALVVAVGVLIWFVRLEGRVNAVEGQVKAQALAIQALESGHGAFQLEMAQKLGEIGAALARIETKLDMADK
jgi:hypothetical protein